MDKALFEALSLEQQEMLVKKEGELIIGEDDYSYRLLYYKLDDSILELMYDNETDTILSISFVDKNNTRPGTQINLWE